MRRYVDFLPSNGDHLVGLVPLGIGSPFLGDFFFVMCGLGVYPAVRGMMSVREAFFGAEVTFLQLPLTTKADWFPSGCQLARFGGISGRWFVRCGHCTC